MPDDTASRECTPATESHVWSADWVSGDTCACGAYYLIESLDGEIEITRTPDPEPA